MATIDQAAHEVEDKAPEIPTDDGQDVVEALPDNPPQVSDEELAETEPETRRQPRKPATRPKSRKQHAGNIPQGMKSALKRSPRKTNSGKPSALDGAAEGAKALGGLSISLILQLAAPHTWVASIVPVLLAMAIAVADQGMLSASMCIVLLFISVLMQSAVNTFNDYRDFVAGTDTKSNQQDPSDAVLVYNDVEPNAVRMLAFIFVGLAFLLGIYVVVRAGFLPLVIAIIGAACIFLYSAGPKPISSAPLGELVSGFVMGGLITLACHIALTGTLNFMVLLISLPVMIGIALIMFTNNTCDIEMDKRAGRRTLAVLMGRRDSVILYRILIGVWVVLIALFVAVVFPVGSLGIFFLLLAYPAISSMLKNPLIHQTRIAAMQTIVNLNAVLGLIYAVSIMLSQILFVIA